MSCIRSCYEKDSPNFGHEDCGTCIHGDRQPQQKQEPVAKYTGETWCGSVVSLYEDIPLDTLLHTSPPQRQWVGLTDEERVALWDRAEKRQAYQGVPALSALIQEVEAKLKEKNT